MQNLCKPATKKFGNELFSTLLKRNQKYFMIFYKLCCLPRTAIFTIEKKSGSHGKLHVIIRR